ncbi:MAG: thermonuclease family protein [Marinosulfonomonas sp.]|nr:thermonuclease family protein [Marinosulfonomonas sp.]
MNGLIKPHKGCRIVGVTDGDTVRMICPLTGFEKGRILGFDTPEMKARCLSELFKAVAASYYLRWTLLKAKQINALPRDRDKYGRRLVFVNVDDRPISRVMINSGLARSYSGGQRLGWCG